MILGDFRGWFKGEIGNFEKSRKKGLQSGAWCDRMEEVDKQVTRKE